MDSIKKKAVFENLDSILIFLRVKLNEFGAEKEVIPDIVLAVEELVVNVISYAYPKQKKGSIKLTCKLVDKIMSIKIEDEGIPFNVLEFKDPDTSVPIHKRRIGGMGIYLVKNVIDDICYQRTKDTNVLTLKKYIK